MFLSKLELENNEELIPPKAMPLLVEILQNMAEGKSVVVIPTESELSTQDAATYLQVSRPHIVKLLEAGQIPFKKVGTHRRIKLTDLLAYEALLRKEQNRQLGFLAAQAQKLGLGYE